MKSAVLLDIARLFTRLGFTAFGGPAAHIAMLEDEVVERRKWLSRQSFLDLIGATNLIPGPNSTEMMMHLGYVRGGLIGMIVAGVCFIVPAVLSTGLLAWFYVHYGTLPAIAPLFAGIQPAVLVIIIAALWKLGKKALKTPLLWVVALGVMGLLFLGIGEVLALFIGALVGMGLLLGVRYRQTLNSNVLPLLVLWSGLGSTIGTRPDVPLSTLLSLFGFFLKVGSVLYGSGYVLIAFLENDLVHRLDWLTQAQLLDSIALGQFTPGPVLSTATFVGYITNGPWGAAVATLGIFLPAFVFVAILHPIVPRLRKHPVTSAFLEAVNSSALTLMTYACVTLAQGSLVSLSHGGIAAAAALAVFWLKWGSHWVVLLGAGLGLLLIRGG